MKDKIAFFLVSLLIIASVALVSFVLVFDGHDVVKKSNQLKINSTIVEVTDLLGSPENICYKAGLSDLHDSTTFGLQWGVDYDGSILPDNIMSADVTIWFDSRGLVVEILAAE